MSRKRSKKHASRKVSTSPESTDETATETLEAAADEAVVADEVLAEGSGPHDAAPDIAELAAVAEELNEAHAHGDAREEAELEAAGDAVAQELSDADLDAGIRETEMSTLSDDALDAALDDDAAELEAAEAMEMSAEAPLGEDGEPLDLDDGDSASLPTSAATMDSVQLKQLLEALVFASDKPITVQRLRQLTRIADVKRLEDALVEIQADYQPRGLILTSVSGGWQFRTRPQFSAWVQQLIEGRPVRLSRAQLETLAIVAYRQPITRPEIDDIRGVDSSATLKLLLDRSLIRVLGKKEEVGRPMLYGTTKDFLDFFSLTDLRELPTLREYSELSDESRQVISKRLGVSIDDIDGSGGGSRGGGGGESGGGGDVAPYGAFDDETGEPGETEASAAPGSIDDMLQAYGESEDEPGEANAVQVEAVEAVEAVEVVASDDDDELAAGSQTFDAASDASAPDEIELAEGSASTPSDALDVEAMVGAMAASDDDVDSAVEPSDAHAAEARDAADGDASEPIEPE